MYTLAKQELQDVNLHCNVTTRPTRNYTHSFDFNVDNAITPKSLSNVSHSVLLTVSSGQYTHLTFKPVSSSNVVVHRHNTN